MGEREQTELAVMADVLKSSVESVSNLLQYMTEKLELNTTNLYEIKGALNLITETTNRLNIIISGRSDDSGLVYHVQSLNRDVKDIYESLRDLELTVRNLETEFREEKQRDAAFKQLRDLEILKANKGLLSMVLGIIVTLFLGILNFILNIHKK